MAPIIVIQLVFLLLAILHQPSGATEVSPRCMILNLYPELPNSTAPCLLRGRPPIRRDDYTYVPNFGGYKLHTRALTWPEARLICQEEGGYLAIINSVAESLAISKILQDSEAIFGSEYQADVSIGFHDLYREGEYVTIHGESLQQAGYDQWYTGQPNNNDVQNCGGVNRNGQLNDLWCNTPFGFLCEIPAS